MVWLIFFAFSVGMTFVFSNLGLSAGDSMITWSWPFLIFDVLFLILYRYSHKMKAKAKLEIEAQRQKLLQIGAFSIMMAKHMAGLSLGQGAECALYLCPDKMIFEKDASTFNLFFNKVLDITVKTNVEIQREYGTSVGGAIAGGALFGPLGAMVGGMQEKEKKIVHKYLIYTYQNNDRVDYISFDVTWVNPKVLNQFVEHYKSLRTEQRVVEL